MVHRAAQVYWTGFWVPVVPWGGAAHAVTFLQFAAFGRIMDI